MRNTDAAAKIIDYAALLQPGKLDVGRLASKFAEYQRGGLPSQSMGGDGRGSAESPLPIIGGVDRQLLRYKNLANEYLVDAAVALERYTRLAAAWCIPRMDDTEKDEKLNAPLKGSGVCSNLTCDHHCNGIGNDRLRHGRCRACYRVFKQTGKDRDARLDQLTSTGGTP